MLEAARVTKRFAGVTALRGVDFLLERGQVHALVGENGAGKSTLVKVLTGVYRPDEGLLFHRGEPVHFSGPQDAQTRGISTVYQETSLVGSMSVSANLYLGREPRNRLGMVSFRQLHANAERLLDSLGIAVDPRRELRSLSLGMQQMVAIARAVSTESRTVIMDEPTSFLQPPEVDTLFQVIRRLHERDVSVIYTSHRLLELFQICNAVTVLRDGEVVHTGLMSSIGPCELVAKMLGREPADIRRAGTAAFPAEHREAVEEVLKARELGRRTCPDNVATVGNTGNQPNEQVRTGSSGEATIALALDDRRGEGLVPHLSIRDNIVLAALPRLSRFGLAARSKQDAVVWTFMQRLRIRATSPDQPVHDLSSEDQEKVKLARWLAMSSKVVLRGEQAEVRVLLRDLAAHGLGIVLVSNDLTDLVEGAHRVVVVRDGVQVAELRGDQVTANAVMAALAEGGT